MGAGQDVGGGAKRTGGIGRAKQEEVPGIAPQLQKPRGRQGAIFQRLVIRPDPEQRLAPGGLNGEAGGKTAGTPVVGKDFMHGAWPKTPAQHGIGRRNPKRDRRPVGGKAIAREEMAQISQFFAFVHGMF